MNATHHSHEPDEIGQILRDKRTPSLVSFVGQTGSGKSTLIKLMIDLAFRRGSQNERNQTPVVGARGAHLPSSEDVHLFLQPRMSETQSPLLLADCEGLEGGEREPIGARLKFQRRAEVEAEYQSGAKLAKGLKTVVEKKLTWATSVSTQSREFAVTNLYPRLLFTFSDAIVFVLRNPRRVRFFDLKTLCVR